MNGDSEVARSRLGAARTLEELASVVSKSEDGRARSLARDALAPPPVEGISFPFAGTDSPCLPGAKVPSLKPAVKLAIYLRDGFIDRFSPERWRLVHPGALQVLSLALGDAMPTELSSHNIPAKYATNAPVWFDVWPAVDHLHARSFGGSNDATNLVCVSWWRNDSKRAYAFESTGWTLQPRGSLADWDGLTSWFHRRVEASPRLLQDPMVRNWHLPSVVASVP